MQRGADDAAIGARGIDIGNAGRAGRRQPRACGRHIGDIEEQETARGKRAQPAGGERLDVLPFGDGFGGEGTRHAAISASQRVAASSSNSSPAHSLTAGSAVKFTGGTAPTGVTPGATYYVVLHDPCSAFGAPQPCSLPAHAVSVHKDIESALREVRKDHINRRMSTVEGEKQ